jgi:hypothetical protein
VPFVARRVVALGGCKWTDEQVGVDEEALLTRLEASVGEAAGRPRHYLFSRAGFAPSLRRLAEADPDRIVLVKTADLYG